MQKLQRRLKALNNSTTLSEELKKKARTIMKTEYMSSEQSQDSSDTETEEGLAGNTSRKLLYRQLRWRSEEATDIMRSLDRKYARRQTPQGRQMTMERVEAGKSDRAQPQDIPDWALEDFQ